MLSAYGWFDGSTGSGTAKQAVQYSAFGAALSEVELDVLTGERRMLRSSIMYDCGYPLNPGIDLGQVRCSSQLWLRNMCYWAGAL
jgi:xanthine dehydrogenase molybdopterin-binding subunit B